MIYRFHTRGNYTDAYALELRDDRTARQTANATTDVVEVRDVKQRVVWRRVNKQEENGESE